MLTTPYPNRFFVAHHLFTGAPFNTGGTWGDLLDGPVDDADACIDKIVDTYRDDAPTHDDLRVWLIQPGQLPVDCTDWAIRSVARIHEAGRWVEPEAAA